VNEVIFQSSRAATYKQLDLGVLLSRRLPTTKRMFRSNGLSGSIGGMRLDFGLARGRLAANQIGMSRSYAPDQR